MEFIRIQDKIISWQKVETSLKKVLQMRSARFFPAGGGGATQD